MSDELTREQIEEWIAIIDQHGTAPMIGLASLRWLCDMALRTVEPPPRQDQEELRRRFEQWFEADAMPLEHSDWFRRDDDLDYELDGVQRAWNVWQAAAASPPPPIAEPEIAELVRQLRMRADDWQRSVQEQPDHVQGYGLHDAEWDHKAADLIESLAARLAAAQHARDWAMQWVDWDIANSEDYADTSIAAARAAQAGKGEGT